MRFWLFLTFAALTINCAVSAPAIASSCLDLSPRSVGAVAPREVAALDLARLRDIGGGNPSPSAPGVFSIAPSGDRVAFFLRRGEPARNAYCVGLFVMPLHPGAEPVLVDLSQELIRDTLDLRGLAGLQTGVPSALAPQWAPDGERLAFLKRTEGVVQVWVIRSDGSNALQITRSDVDIEAVAWTSDGRGLVTSSRPHLLELRAAIEQEGLGGHLYDARFNPNVSDRPIPQGPVTTSFEVVDIRTGEHRAATPSEADRVPPAGHRHWPSNAVFLAESEQDVRAWIAIRSPERFFGPLDLYADTTEGPVRCDAPACDGSLVGVWLDSADETVVFMRREGWARSQLALYRWSPGYAPRRVFLTEDALIGCQQRMEQLLCVRESSTRPGHLVLLDMRDGSASEVLDLNPEFALLRLGSASRLRWRSAQGTEVFGDLVLPPDHRPGQQHPLVVVQYTSRGFLRGGSGDEYPVQAFAARGFAVLNFERPRDYATDFDASNAAEFQRINVQDWADRRHVLSALEAGVQEAITLGVVDRERIGITGLSDGASTVQFALLNSQLFRVASVSSCCADPNTMMIIGGPAYAAHLRDVGYPLYTTRAVDFWEPISFAVNADRVTAPILMQLADDEYEMALEAYWSLRERGQPVEMYVFPDEHHVKWQPAHRLAIYERNLDWFDFWLQGYVDPDPRKAEQYRRWEEMRERRATTSTSH